MLPRMFECGGGGGNTATTPTEKTHGLLSGGLRLPLIIKKKLVLRRRKIDTVVSLDFTLVPLLRAWLLEASRPCITTLPDWDIVERHLIFLIRTSGAGAGGAERYAFYCVELRDCFFSVVARTGSPRHLDDVVIGCSTREERFDRFMRESLLVFVGAVQRGVYARDEFLRFLLLAGASPVLLIAACLRPYKQLVAALLEDAGEVVAAAAGALRSAPAADGAPLSPL